MCQRITGVSAWSSQYICECTCNGSEYKNRIASTMDMFPTTIAALGGEIEGDRLGLGTNLFSGRPTLAEELGMDQLNAEVRKNSLFYAGLAGGMEVDDSVMDMK